MVHRGVDGASRGRVQRGDLGGVHRRVDAGRREAGRRIREIRSSSSSSSRNRSRSGGSSRNGGGGSRHGDGSGVIVTRSAPHRAAHVQPRIPRFPRFPHRIRHRTHRIRKVGGKRRGVRQRIRRVRRRRGIAHRARQNRGKRRCVVDRIRHDFRDTPRKIRADFRHARGPRGTGLCGLDPRGFDVGVAALGEGLGIPAGALLDDGECALEPTQQRAFPRLLRIFGEGVNEAAVFALAIPAEKVAADLHVVLQDGVAAALRHRQFPARLPLHHVQEPAPFPAGTVSAAIIAARVRQFPHRRLRLPRGGRAERSLERPRERVVGVPAGVDAGRVAGPAGLGEGRPAGEGGAAVLRGTDVLGEKIVVGDERRVAGERARGAVGGVGGVARVDGLVLRVEALGGAGDKRTGQMMSAKVGGIVTIQYRHFGVVRLFVCGRVVEIVHVLGGDAVVKRILMISGRKVLVNPIMFQNQGAVRLMGIPLGNDITF